MVTRQVDSDLEVLFYTDARSPKVRQIKANPFVTALFWHPRQKLQVRIKGSAELLPEHDDRFKGGLNDVLHSPSKSDYMSLHPPGSISDPWQLTDDDPEEEIHFAAVLIRPESIDILQLRPDGHRRVVATPKSGLWHVVNIIP